MYVSWRYAKHKEPAKNDTRRCRRPMIIGMINIGLNILVKFMTASSIPSQFASLSGKTPVKERRD